MLIIFALTALGALCLVLFHLAALALPLVAGISAAMLAYESGTGLLGAGVIGFLVGVATLSVGQFLFATMRSPTVRVLTAMLFAAPAAVVGFSVVHRILVAGDSTEVWAVILGVIGATVTGGVAISKVSALAPTTPGRASLPGSETSGATVDAPSRR